MRLVDTQDTDDLPARARQALGEAPEGPPHHPAGGHGLSDFVAEDAPHRLALRLRGPKSKSLYSTLDKLNARFGKQAVYFASAHKARDRGGMHIAFNHIPDPEDRTK